MPATALPDLDRFAAAQPDRPQGFAERGVAVPFTTPMLAGARLRRRPGGAAELVLPAFGGRGVYVLDWEACLGFATPTLHDRKLWDRVAVLPRLAPAPLRAAARAAAAQGHAGRGAQAAAVAALGALTRAREEAKRWIGVAVAPLLGEPGAPRRLDAFAAALAEVGPGGAIGPVLAARLDALSRLSEGLLALAPTVAEEPRRQAALLVAAAAKLAIATMPCCLRPLREALAQLQVLFAGGDAALEPLAALAERPDWILDGWPELVALWEVEPPEGRAALLGDLLILLPTPPREIEAWSSRAAAWEALAQGRRRIALRPRWAAQSRTELVARHEQALERAA